MDNLGGMLGARREGRMRYNVGKGLKEVRENVLRWYGHIKRMDKNR